MSSVAPGRVKGVAPHYTGTVRSCKGVPVINKVKTVHPARQTEGLIHTLTDSADSHPIMIRGDLNGGT